METAEKVERKTKKSPKDKAVQMSRIARQVSAGVDRLCDLIAEMNEDGEKPKPTPKPRKRTLKTPRPAGPAPTIKDFHNSDDVKKDHAIVSFDDDKRVNLPAALAELITILADDAESLGEFVAFKSFDLIAEKLKKRFNRRFSRHNVSQLLTRLRSALDEAGHDIRLIESVRGEGARLRRLKRQSAGQTAEPRA